MPNTTQLESAVEKRRGKVIADRYEEVVVAPLDEKTKDAYDNSQAVDLAHIQTEISELKKNKPVLVKAVTDADGLIQPDVRAKMVEIRDTGVKSEKDALDKEYARVVSEIKAIEDPLKVQEKAAETEYNRKLRDVKVEREAAIVRDREAIDAINSMPGANATDRLKQLGLRNDGSIDKSILSAQDKRLLELLSEAPEEDNQDKVENAFSRIKDKTSRDSKLMKLIDALDGVDVKEKITNFQKRFNSTADIDDKDQGLLKHLAGLPETAPNFTKDALEADVDLKDKISKKLKFYDGIAKDGNFDGVNFDDAEIQSITKSKAFAKPLNSATSLAYPSTAEAAVRNLGNKIVKKYVLTAEDKALGRAIQNRVGCYIDDKYDFGDLADLIKKQENDAYGEDGSKAINSLARLAKGNAQNGLDSIQVKFGYIDIADAIDIRNQKYTAAEENALLLLKDVKPRGHQSSSAILQSIIAKYGNYKDEDGADVVVTALDDNNDFNKFAEKLGLTEDVRKKLNSTKGSDGYNSAVKKLKDEFKNYKINDAEADAIIAIAIANPATSITNPVTKAVTIHAGPQHIFRGKDIVDLDDVIKAREVKLSIAEEQALKDVAKVGGDGKFTGANFTVGHLALKGGKRGIQEREGDVFGRVLPLVEAARKSAIAQESLNGFYSRANDQAVIDGISQIDPTVSPSANIKALRARCDDAVNKTSLDNVDTSDEAEFRKGVIERYVRKTNSASTDLQNYKTKKNASDVEKAFKGIEAEYLAPEKAEREVIEADVYKSYNQEKNNRASKLSELEKDKKDLGNKIRVATPTKYVTELVISDETDPAKQAALRKSAESYIKKEGSHQAYGEATKVLWKVELELGTLDKIPNAEKESRKVSEGKLEELREITKLSQDDWKSLLEAERAKAFYEAKRSSAVLDKGEIAKMTNADRAIARMHLKITGNEDKDKDGKLKNLSNGGLILDASQEKEKTDAIANINRVNAAFPVDPDELDRLTKDKSEHEATIKQYRLLEAESKLYEAAEKEYSRKQLGDTHPGYAKYKELKSQQEQEAKRLAELEAEAIALPKKKYRRPGFESALGRHAGYLAANGSDADAIKALKDDAEVDVDIKDFKNVIFKIEGDRLKPGSFKEVDVDLLKLHLNGQNKKEDAPNDVLKAFYREAYHEAVFKELFNEEKKDFYKAAAIVKLGGTVDQGSDLAKKFGEDSWRKILLDNNSDLIERHRSERLPLLEGMSSSIEEPNKPSSYERLAQRVVEKIRVAGENGGAIDPDKFFKEALSFEVDESEKANHEAKVKDIFGGKKKFIGGYQSERLIEFSKLLTESWMAAIEAAKDTANNDKQKESGALINRLDDEFLKGVSSSESRKFYNKIFAEFVWEKFLEETKDDLMAKYAQHKEAGYVDADKILDNEPASVNKMLRHFFKLQVPKAEGGSAGKFGGEMDTSLLEEEFNKKRAADLAKAKVEMRAELAAEDVEIEEAKRAKSSGAKSATAGNMSMEAAAATVQRIWRRSREVNSRDDDEEVDRAYDSKSKVQRDARGNDRRFYDKGLLKDIDFDQRITPNLGAKLGSRGLNVDDDTLQGIIGELANIRNSIGVIECKLGLPSAGPSTISPYNMGMGQGFSYQGPNAPYFQQQQYQGGGAGYYQGPSTFPQQYFNGGNHQFNYGPPPFAAGGHQQWGSAGMPSNGPNQEVEQIKRQLEATTAKLEEVLAGGKSVDSKGQPDGNAGGNSGANASSSEAAKKSMPTNTMSGDVDIDDVIKYLKGSKKPSSMIPQIIGSSEESVDGEKGRRGSAKILDNGLVVVQYNSANEFNEHIAKARGNFRDGASLTGSKHESLISLVEINVNGGIQHKVVKSDSKGIEVHHIDEQEYERLIDKEKLNKPIPESKGEDSRASKREALMQNIAFEFSGEKVSFNKRMKDDLLKQCENEKVFGIRVPERWGGRKDKLKGAMEDAYFSISGKNETVIERNHNNKNRVTVTINGESGEDAMVSIGNGCYIKVMAKDTAMPDGTEVKAGKAAPDRIYMNGHPDGIDISGGMFRRSLFKSGNLLDALTVDGDKRGARDRAEEIMKRYNELQLIVCKNATDSASISFMVDGKTHGMKLGQGERIAFVVAAAGVTAALGVATAGIASAAIIGATTAIAGTTTLAGLTAAGGVATINGAVDVVDKISPSSSPKLKGMAHISQVASKSEFYVKYADSGSRQ